jgi:hypothetical protein
MRLWLVIPMAFLGGIAAGAAAMSHQPATADRVYQSPAGTKLKFWSTRRISKGPKWKWLS